ncbi:MAG: endonuclease III [Clostridia bacterium]|nr:endonuclease III [Clostridia bacterium]
MLTKKEKQRRAKKAVEVLKERYPSAECALRYDGDPWKLLVMGRLSAQCTDARVNIVCEELFRRFPDMESMADASVEEIERLIYSCGFYKVKAQNLKDFSAIISGQYGGRVPDTMEELLTLPGVGRKIANLILGDIYGKPAIVADTHCIRISNRLGLCESKTPEKVERTLIPLVEPLEQADFCHRLVWFGREVCDARKPKCEECPLRDCCEEVKLREKEGKAKC